MKLPIVIVPTAINQLMLAVNAPRAGTFVEDYVRICSVIPEEKIDGHEILILTHCFSGPGRQRYFAHVNGNNPQTMMLEQLIGNHLTECAKVAGFPSAGVVGIFHTHPTASDTSFSGDDLATFRRHALTTQSNFTLAPIACRYGGHSYVKWYFFNAIDDRVYLIPEKMIHVVDEQELEEQFPGIGKFLAVKPSHIIANIDSILPNVLAEPSTTSQIPRPLHCPSPAGGTPVSKSTPRTPARKTLLSVMVSVIIALLAGFGGVIAGRASIKQPKPVPMPTVAYTPTAVVFTAKTTSKTLQEVRSLDVAPTPPTNIPSKPRKTANKKSRPNLVSILKPARKSAQQPVVVMRYYVGQIQTRMSSSGLPQAASSHLQTTIAASKSHGHATTPQESLTSPEILHKTEPATATTPNQDTKMTPSNVPELRWPGFVRQPER